MAPLSSVTLGLRGTWPASMEPSPYSFLLSLSFSLSLTSHKVRQNKIKREGSSLLLAHTRAAAQVARATSTLEDGTAMGCPTGAP